MSTTNRAGSRLWVDRMRHPTDCRKEGGELRPKRIDEHTLDAELPTRAAMPVTMKMSAGFNSPQTSPMPMRHQSAPAQRHASPATAAAGGRAVMFTTQATAAPPRPPASHQGSRDTRWPPRSSSPAEGAPSASAISTPQFVRISMPGSPFNGRAGLVLPPKGVDGREWSLPESDGMVRVMFESLDTVSVDPNCCVPVRSVSEAATSLTYGKGRREVERQFTHSYEARDRSYVWQHGKHFNNGLSTGFENVERIQDAWGSLNEMAETAISKKLATNRSNRSDQDSFSQSGGGSQRSDLSSKRRFSGSFGRRRGSLQ